MGLLDMTLPQWQAKHTQRESVGDVAVLDETVVALLDERSRARDDEHRRLIDFELKQRGYEDPVEEKSEPKPEEARAEASHGDRTTQPHGQGPVRGKQQQQRRY